MNAVYPTVRTHIQGAEGKMITTGEPHCPACGMALKGNVVKGKTECKNCGAAVEVTFRAAIEYETKVVD